jgi:hypothetical protein
VWLLVGEDGLIAAFLRNLDVGHRGIVREVAVEDYCGVRSPIEEVGLSGSDGLGQASRCEEQ